MMTMVRALLAVALLAGFYVLGSVLVLAYVALVVGMVISVGSPYGSLNNAGSLINFAAGGAPVIAAVVHGMVTFGRPPDVLPGAVPLLRDDAPRLWDLVTELADEIGAPVPTEMWLTGEANAAVSERTRLLGLVVNDRWLYIGMPLLTGLSTAELRAVLCHELGHYARGHTRFGALTYRGSVALATTRRRIAAAMAANGLVMAYSSLQFWMLSRYAAVYDRVSFAVRRRLEYEADDAAADVCGAEVAADALRSTHVLAAAWADFEARIVQPMRRAGLVPDDPYRAFDLMLADPDYRELLAEWRADPPQPRRSRLDSHPSLDQRLANLARHRGRSGPGEPAAWSEGSDGSAPAIELLADPGIARTRVWAAQDGWSLTRLPLREWVDALAQRQATGPARELAAAVRRLRRSQELTAATVLDLLEAGKAARLAAAMAGPTATGTGQDTVADAHRAQLTAAVFVLAAHCLVATGRAGWTAGWAGPGRLVARDVTAGELYDLVQSAVDNPTEVPRLRLHLASLGVNVAAPVTLTRSAPAAPGGSSSVVIEPADRDERRRVSAISLGTAGVLLVVVLAAALGRDEPEPTFPNAGQLSDAVAAQGGPGGVGGLGGVGVPTTSFALPPAVVPWIGCPSPTDYSCLLTSMAERPPFMLDSIVTVAPGDTLTSIACRHNSTVAELIELNALPDDRIAVGQVLTVPGPASPVAVLLCG